MPVHFRAPAKLRDIEGEIDGQDRIYLSVGSMPTAIEAPLYDVGVLSGSGSPSADPIQSSREWVATAHLPGNVWSARDCKRKVRMRRSLLQCIRSVMKPSLLAMMYSAPCCSIKHVGIESLAQRQVKSEAGLTCSFISSSARLFAALSSLTSGLLLIAIFRMRILPPIVRGEEQLRFQSGRNWDLVSVHPLLQDHRTEHD